MAKKPGKKGKMPGRFNRSEQAPRAENPFELIHSRKKFDVLGKKQKGVAKKISKGRNEGTQKRKDTLLVEYKQLRKANTFLDKRFGEDDESLTAEEKAVMRFQQQRMKDASSNKFALTGGSDDEEGGLTHGGQPLGDIGEDGFGRLGSDDEEMDERLNAQMTGELNFGGGFVRKEVPTTAPEGAGVDEPGEHRRTKKEVMEEVMAKSKSYKAERQLQREDDLVATEQLDVSFQTLVGGGALQSFVRPKGAKMDTKAIPQSEEEVRFDRMRRELVFEARGAPGERARTVDELAEMERQRLEVLERQRLKRMRGGDDDDATDDEMGAPAGGFAARRYKAARADTVEEKSGGGGGGDDLNDDFDLSEEEGSSDGEGGSEEEEEEGGSDPGEEGPLQKRQRKRAAGGDELQSSFRMATAALLRKHGAKPTSQSAAELDQAQFGSDEEASGEEADGSDEESDGSDEEADDGDGGSEGGAEQLPAEKGGRKRAKVEEGSSHEADAAMPSAEEDEPTGDDAATVAAPQGAAPKAKNRLELEGPLDITFTPSVPQSYASFAALVWDRPPAEVSLIIGRIRGANAAALNTENRRKMQEFYGILVQHFATLAGRSPLDLPALDSLATVLAPATAEVPFYAATVARARLARFQQRLSAALAAPTEANDYGWPAPRVVLQLQLFAALFPLSDRRHPVATPLALLTGAYLALCSPSRPRHAVIGLLLASAATHAAAAGARMAPEPLGFAARLIAGAAAGAEHPDGWLAPGVSDAASLPETLHALRLSEVLSSAAEADAACDLPAVRQSALVAALRLVGRLAVVLGELPAFPELFAPVGRALAALGEVSHLHKDVRAAQEDASAAVQQRSVAAVAARKPLVRRSTKAATVRMFNPRFEEDFAANKDYDPDRERAATKKLKRQLQQERRGAMRELRKDAVFISEEQDAEKATAKAERRAAGRAGLAIMQAQEADMKSGGQGGMWKKGGKKPFSRRN